MGRRVAGVGCSSLLFLLLAASAAQAQPTFVTLANGDSVHGIIAARRDTRTRRRERPGARLGGAPAPGRVRAGRSQTSSICDRRRGRVYVVGEWMS